jgi:hypothetical protein
MDSVKDIENKCDLFLEDSHNKIVNLLEELTLKDLRNSLKLNIAPEVYFLKEYNHLEKDKELLEGLLYDNWELDKLCVKYDV